MHFHYATRTIHCPVRAVGKDLFNSFGVRFATAIGDWEAAAMADLINAGHPVMKAREDEHDAEEDRRAGLLIRARQRLAKAQG